MGRSTKLRGYGRMLLLLLLLGNHRGFAQYRLHIIPVDRDSIFIRDKLALARSFKNRAACTEYIFTIPSLLQVKGYMTASVDTVGYDSTGASVRLYIGPVYRWARISTRKIEPALLGAVGWN